MTLPQPMVVSDTNQTFEDRDERFTSLIFRYYCVPAPSSRVCRREEKKTTVLYLR